MQQAAKAKSKRKICSLKVSEKFLIEMKNEEKKINEEIFNEFFNYHYRSFLIKDLYEDNQNKNDKIVINISE